jgi:hypothetical protein
VPVDAASGDWRLRGPTRRKTRPAQEYARLVQLQNTGLCGIKSRGGVALLRLEVLWARLCRWFYMRVGDVAWAVSDWSDGKYVETLYWLDRIEPGWDD